MEALAPPLRPPVAWFRNPELLGPTAVEVTGEGRIFGHAALWDSCHISEPNGAGVCVSPPRSHSNYAYFHLGSVETEEGEIVAVGQITLDAPHAPLRAGLRDASRHYDHTGTACADVRVGEDQFGIWVAGALRSDVPEEKVRALAASKLSGDWRGMRGNLEMVGLLAVNVPGFPVPRVAARVAAGGPLEEPRLALVASGIVPDPPMTVKQARIKMAVLTARARGGRGALVELANRGF